MIDPKAHKAAEEVLSFKSYRTSVWKFYLIGKELFYYREQFLSDKIFGQKLKLYCPKIAELPAAKRSDCIWLYKALENQIDSDLLPTIGVQRIEEFYSSDPSVIRQAYRKRKKEIQNSLKT
jgi:hypothetical protein